MASKAGKKLVPLSGDLAAMYDAHRKRYDQGWGLAWYLASELCDRFHASHGIAFETESHEGLGYYGIAMRRLPCKANRHRELPHLGRFAMAGDVENWITGSPGDHGLPLEERAQNGGEPLEALVAAAIAHLRLPARPAERHDTCRHKRRGASFCLLFRIATMIALRYNSENGIEVCNHPKAFDRLLGEHDPKFGEKEYPGAFHFSHEDRMVSISGDGRVLLSPESSPSLWERFMVGESEVSLARWILDQMGAP